MSRTDDESFDVSRCSFEQFIEYFFDRDIWFELHTRGRVCHMIEALVFPPCLCASVVDFLPT